MGSEAKRIPKIPGRTECEDSDWPCSPSPAQLAPGEVHVWRASLDQSPESVARLAELLGEDERERAARFFFEKDRRRFTVARGILRTLLAGYLGIRPEAVRFRYGLRGKPFLEPEGGAETLRFNLSHSNEMALLAFSPGRELGIDIEWMRANLACEQIAERFFSPSEVGTLRSLPPEVRPRAFFTCWTRKEAFIKARGTGLSSPLAEFDVSLAPGEPARLLRTAWDRDEAARWELRELHPAPNYAAALAVEGAGWRLHRWHWLPAEEEPGVTGVKP